MAESATQETPGQQVIDPQREAGIKLAAQLEDMAPRWANSLPKHIPVERFKRVVMTAIQRNPDLMEAERASLFLACQEAANDGLMPNGKEGALVIYRTKVKRRDKTGREAEIWIDKVQWMPMVAGLRKKVRNSDEISDWRCEVVHERDQFHYELGDRPSLTHIPYEGPEDPGKVVKAYSIAWFKDGTISREVMSAADIGKVRGASKAPNSPAWNVWYEEMAKKAVARRHAKTLPMSTDLDDLIRRDDELYDFEGASDKKQIAPPRPERTQFQGGQIPAQLGHVFSDSVVEFQPRDAEVIEPDKPAAPERKEARASDEPREGATKAPATKPPPKQEQPPAATEKPNKPTEATKAEKQTETSTGEVADEKIVAAERAGGAAFKEGKSLHSPPDEFRSELAHLEAWKDGWRHAEFESRPKKGT